MTNCRFYQKKWPEPNDLVVVKVKSVTGSGIYTELLEYNNVEGFMALSELARRNVRRIRDIIKAGQEEIMMVVRVDAAKHFIDLSLKRVEEEERKLHRDKYEKAKFVHSMIRHVAETCNESIEDLYDTCIWPYMEETSKTAHDIIVIENDHALQLFSSASIPVQECLQKTMKQRLRKQTVQIIAKIQLFTTHPDGIDRIKNILKIEPFTSAPVQIRSDSIPNYVVWTVTDQPEEGLRSVSQVCERIQQLAQSGFPFDQFNIIVPPTVKQKEE